MGLGAKNTDSAPESERAASSPCLVRLDPDVARIFKTEEFVNSALRSIIQFAQSKYQSLDGRKVKGITIQ